MQVRTLDQFMRAAEVRDELTDRDSVGVTVEDDGIVQRSGRNPAVVFRFNPRQASEDRWIISGTRLGDLRLRCQGHVRSSLNARVILNGNLLRLLQSKTLRGLRQARHGGYRRDHGQNQQAKLHSHWAPSVNGGSGKLACRW